MNVNSTSGFTRNSFWLGEPNTGMFSWLYLPSEQNRQPLAIVLCPPLGHEYTHSHRCYRHLAERLALAGITVTRFDYIGTGDSTGTLLDAGLVTQWQANIEQQMAYLRALEHVNYCGAFGVRLGASLALALSTRVRSDFLVMWQPVVSGKRYVRELKAVSRMAANSNSNADFYEAGGFPISHELEADLKALDLTAANTFKLSKLLFLQNDANDTTFTPLLDSLQAQLDLSIVAARGYNELMAEPQFTEVPELTLSHVRQWLLELVHRLPEQTLSITPDTVLRPQTINKQTEFVERELCYGGIFALACQPTAKTRAVFVLANSGSVHHVGPNRLYVEMSRALAQQGIMTVRMDLSNLGDSAHIGSEQENVTYPQTAIDDTLTFIRALKTEFSELPIMLGGLCSGAHTAFHAAKVLKTELKKVVIINPLTFYWQEGMSLDIPQSYEVNKEAKHYERSLKSKDSWKKLLTGKVNYLYLLSFIAKLTVKYLAVSTKSVAEKCGLLKKAPLAKDLLRLVDSGLEVDFVFSSKDPGYTILQEEGGYTVKKLIRNKAVGITIIAEADHTFSKVAYRNDLANALNDILSTNSIP